MGNAGLLTRTAKHRQRRFVNGQHPPSRVAGPNTVGHRCQGCAELRRACSCQARQLLRFTACRNLRHVQHGPLQRQCHLVDQRVQQLYQLGVEGLTAEKGQHAQQPIPGYQRVAGEAAHAGCLRPLTITNSGLVCNVIGNKRLA